MIPVRSGCGSPSNQKSVQKVKTYSGFDFFVQARRGHTNSKKSNLTSLPPHHHKLAMKTYINTLNEMAKAAFDRQSDCVDKSRVGVDPLELQIERWWLSLPPVMQSRLFRIDEIAAQCRGRYRDRPALREVAAALRFLGWKTYRDWKKNGCSSRLWMPMTSPQSKVSQECCHLRAEGVTYTGIRE